MSPKNHGTYVKDGHERVAHTPADAVQLEFAGWRRKPEPASVRPAAPAAPATADSADAAADGAKGKPAAGR